MMTPSPLPRIALAAFAITSTQCTFIAQGELKRGIGQACQSDNQCQNASCNKGVCANACTSSSDCLKPTLCIESFCRFGCVADADCPNDGVCIGNACSPPVKLAALMEGSAQGAEDGWTAAHKASLDAAAAGIPRLKNGGEKYLLEENVTSAEQYEQLFDSLADDGTTIFVTASRVGDDEAVSKAGANTTASFVTFADFPIDNGNRDNVGAYYQNPEQGWFVAGKVAAQVMGGVGNKCVGLILPTPTHKIVRAANGFVRGVRFQSNNLFKVVIRWVGAERDPRGASETYTATNYQFGPVDGKLFREELLAAQLADYGCAAIAHMTGTQRIVATVETKLKTKVYNGAFDMMPLYSIGSDIRYACTDDFSSGGKWFGSCIGSLYWDWTTQYKDVLDQILAGGWKGSTTSIPFQAGPAAPLRFELNPSPGLVKNLAAKDVQDLVVDAATKGYEGLWTGPLTFTGQRDGDADGTADDQDLSVDQPMSPQEVAQMCSFMDGTFELLDPTLSPTSANVVPAVVPGGPAPAPGSKADVAGNTDVAVDQTSPKYKDVYDFELNLPVPISPETAMNCSKSPE